MPQVALNEPIQEEMSVALYEEAKQLTIQTPADYAYAGEIVKKVDLMIKEIQGTFEKMKKAAHEAHKEACDQERRHLSEPLEVKAFVRSAMLKWDSEQDAIRLEEEQRLNEEARKRETEAKIQEAIAAEAAGETEVAEEILSEPVYVPPVILPKATPKVQGVRFTTVWKWRLTNKKKVPAEWFVLDEARIGAYVRACKRAGEVIPGVEAYSEKV